MIMLSRISAVILAAGLLFPLAVSAEPFQSIRIGDADGFGFARTADLARPIQGIGPGPADSNANGVLEPDEFLPDLNRDGGVWYAGADNFDNRSDAERKDSGHTCTGCLTVSSATHGSKWTDLSLSPTAPPVDWPDLNGPATPNSAAFVFDFTVDAENIAQGAQIFFNLVFGDYDVDPAVVFVRFREAIAIGVSPEAPFWVSFVIVGGCWLMGVMIFGGYALLFSTNRMSGIYGRARRWIETGAGLGFGAAGIGLIVSQR